MPEPERAFFPAAYGLRTSQAVNLIFTGFSQPQLAPGLFLSPRLHLAYLLCEAPVSREPMSRPWDEEVSGQERQGAWAL